MIDLTPAELELVVLSSLRSLDAVRNAQDAGICEDSFQVDAHAKAWGYLVERAEAGYSVSTGDLRAYSHVDLHDDVTDDSTFMRDLVRVTLARQTRSALLKYVGDIEAEPTEAISNIVSELNGVVKSGKGRTVYFDGDAMDRYKALLEKKAKLERGETIGYKTGLRCFDDQRLHWQPSEVCAIIGPLNVGKSTLLFWLAANVYFWSKKKILVLSPESTVEEVQAKFDATISRWINDANVFGVREITDGTVDADRYLEYLNELAMSARKDLIIRDSGSQGAFTIGDVTSLVRQYEPDFLAIDGFHLIKGPGDSWQKMQDAAITIKGLAQGTGMIVAATSQVQRTAIMAPDDPAEIGQSAYGLALAEAADRVISMAEVRGAPQERVFKVPKMRGAAKITFRKRLGFDVDAGHIWEPGGDDRLEQFD